MPSSPLLVHLPKCISLTPQFHAFISRVTESLHRAFSRRRPWPELLDCSAFSQPHSFSDATSRIRKNLSYFRVNYLALIGSVLAFSLLSHPLSLLSLILLVSAWLFLYFFKPIEQPLILLGRTISNHETLALLLVASIVVMFFTRVGSLLMYASLIGGVIVCVHGAIRDPEDLFLDGQDRVSSAGFFSISNAASISSVGDVASIV